MHLRSARSFVVAGTFLVAGLSVPALRAQDDRAFLREAVFAAGQWRNLGPVNFGGRIVDVEADPGDAAVWYVMTATGGLWKTENNGTTFEPSFQNEAAISLGDLAIAPSDGNVLWLGTGEANNQRSSYWGNGVYRSTDAGKTWTHAGLSATEHIGRIAVHPKDPNVAWVAALGALYSPNEERGLFRTRDGGAHWECVKHLGPDVGFVDVVVDPEQPSNLLAASYDRRRRAWHFREAGEGSAVWRSTDGGDTWEQVEGIATGEIGRIGLAMFLRDPKVCYAIVENVNPAPPREEPPPRGEGSDNRASGPRAADPEVYPFGEAEAEAESAPGAPERRRPIGGEVYRSTDGGAHWEKVSDRPVGGSPHYYYGQIRIDPNQQDRVYVLGVRVWTSSDGGKTWDTGFGRGLHVDHHALWIDPADSRRALLGNDGGIAQTWDGGGTWHYYDELPIGQFYAVGVDLRRPYNVYGGTQDNGTWGIPSRRTTNRPLGKADAFKIGGGDGFYVAVDPENPDLVYCESQFGGLMRVDLAANTRTRIQPRARRGDPRLRFNWMTPILVSPHNPHTIYVGSQYLHRSVDRGDEWAVVSPDLTTNDREKVAGNVPHCTITTISESPVREGLLWVGTDDGKVWVSRNGGQRWVDVTDRLPGVPPNLWVSRVEASPHDADRAYVAITGYREDLREPWLYMTEDGGESFRSIAHDLPRMPINVVREHPRNDQVLFVGNESAVLVSVDAGASWHPIGAGLPTVAVHDLLVHPREDDLVIGTHGRGLWVLDITAYGELNTDVLAQPFHVFPPRDGHRTGRAFAPVRYPDAVGWTPDSAVTDAVFRYYLAEDSDAAVTVQVFDAAGNELWSRRTASEAGLHAVTWEPRARGRQGRGQRGAPERPAGPGQYLLRITHGETVVERPFRVHPAPGMADGDAAEDAVESAPREAAAPGFLW